jgi:cyclopropane fatty-acyl-phospholipid synthase-like methyltransferase
MLGTPEVTKQWVRGYYAESTELILNNWAGAPLAFHLGLDDGSCATRADAMVASNEYLATRADIREGTRVLDSGCGVGGSSIWLCRDRRARVVGITISPEQVAIARRLAREAGLADRVEFHEMDFAATSFVAGSFDVVWNMESMCHAFDKQQYLRHVWHMLAPGGRFVCLDLFGRGGEEAPIVREMLRDWSMTSVPPVGEIRSALEEVGFVDVEHEDLTQEVHRPLQALQAMAANSRQMLRIEKATTGSCSAGHEAHVRGALACAGAVAAGVLDYGYVGARRP